MLQVKHEGFAAAPVAAVRAFFEYYRLPLPAAPPALFRELSNPLLLRLFCQAAGHDAGLLSRPIPGLSRIIEAIFQDVDVRAQRRLGPVHIRREPARRCSAGPRCRGRVRRAISAGWRARRGVPGR